MGRWHRNERAAGLLHLPLDTAALARIRADCEQDTRPLAIQAEAFGTGDGDECPRHRRGCFPDDLQILLEPVAQAVIGRVDQGDGSAFGQDREQMQALLPAEIGAGRIVAGPMKDEHVPFAGIASGLEDCIEIDRLRRHVEIGMRHQIQTG